MKKKITISLNDHDSYFLAGLQYGLIEYFTDLSTQVDFFSGYSVDKPDIIFQALSQGERTDICRHFPADAPQPLYFVIRDKAERRFTPPIRCIAKSSTLYRNQSLGDMLGMVKVAMQLRSLPPERMHHCPACHRRSLTERERQVLHYLRQGVSQSQTAHILQLKVKTVHSHKRSAMKKLNFTRTSELFHWLLQGGLTLNLSR
ncbi:fimbriae regulatory protein FimW [Serratia fonticola]|uniref:helix-turn-helix transcriptional regulator n=1 Tax=Serratia fonticola TaxID=47917 RepID=UPI00217845A7|nr:LuxR family transcriptional regulator [Serratia fonticola]CAI0837807.1 fimbriae regulatory protein FimW [Serratia fonticola]CAI0986163.1 fimbriae regulatory protein FimW [Serratia fonticola]CAI1698791.1 fimbriae regulatory protein FimW [Serratia fonticola]